MTTTTKTYRLFRTGFSQWYDDGGRWISDESAAREFTSLERAEEIRDSLNEELGADDVEIR